VSKCVDAYNGSIDRQLKKELNESKEPQQIEKQSPLSNTSINVDSIKFTCHFINNKYARIKADTLLLDTLILNKVIKQFNIKVSPVYFHTLELTESGEEYAIAINGITSVYENPPRTKQDIINNNIVSKIQSAITDCDIVLKSKDINFETANSYIDLINNAADIYRNNKSNTDARVLKALNLLSQKLITAQKFIYPITRKLYTKHLHTKLWENDISVEHSGTTITFTGGSLASNKNKKDLYSSVNELLRKFRFKRANFKWFKYDDQYTYWTIDSPTDTKID
jgi:hypothetical protein